MLVSRTEGNTAYADYSAHYNETHRTRRKTSARKASPMLKASTIAVILVGMILLYLFQLSLVTGAGYRVLEAQNELAVIKNKNKALSVEVAQLKSLDRIENVARNELEMVTPRGASILAVKTKPEAVENISLPSKDEEYVVPVSGNIALKQAAREVFAKVFSRVTASWFGEILSYLI